MSVLLVRLSQQSLTAAPPNYNEAYTFCTWVYFTALGLQQNILSLTFDNTNQDTLFYQFPEDKISVFSSSTPGTGTATTQGTLTPSTGTWYFVAMIRRSSSSLQLYTGTGPSDLALTASNTVVLNARTAATILRVGAVSSPPDFWLDGRLAGTRIWSGYAMSLAELQLEAANGKPYRTANLWGSWPLRDWMDDRSGNGRDLTLLNGPVTWPADPTIPGMVPLSGDRVRETTTTTGTGNVTLAGAASGFVAFSSIAGILPADQVTYAIVGTTEWEVGLGSWHAGNILHRDTVLASSNAGALVSFSAGSKDVFNDFPAQFGALAVASEVQVGAGLIPSSSGVVVVDEFEVDDLELGTDAALEIR